MRINVLLPKNHNLDDPFETYENKKSTPKRLAVLDLHFFIKHIDTHYYHCYYDYYYYKKLVSSSFYIYE